MLDISSVSGPDRRRTWASRAGSVNSRWIMVAVFVVSILVIWLAITQLSHLEAAHAVREIRPLSP